MKIEISVPEVVNIFKEIQQVTPVKFAFIQKVGEAFNVSVLEQPPSYYPYR